MPLPDLPPALDLYLAGLKSHDLGKIAESFAGEIVFVTPARTMDHDEILAFLGALYRGCPDWHYDHDPPLFRADGRIGIKWRQGGTHTATLEFPGFEAHAATGKSVVIPEHFFYYRVGENGLTEIRPDPVPGGAPRGIFEQIGVESPPL